MLMQLNYIKVLETVVDSSNARLCFVLYFLREPRKLWTYFSAMVEHLRCSNVPLNAWRMHWSVIPYIETGSTACTVFETCPLHITFRTLSIKIILEVFSALVSPFTVDIRWRTVRFERKKGGTDPFKRLHKKEVLDFQLSIKVAGCEDLQERKYRHTVELLIQRQIRTSCCIVIAEVDGIRAVLITLLGLFLAYGYRCWIVLGRHLVKEKKALVIVSGADWRDRKHWCWW